MERVSSYPTLPTLEPHEERDSFLRKWSEWRSQCALLRGEWVGIEAWLSNPTHVNRGAQHDASASTLWDSGDVLEFFCHSAQSGCVAALFEDFAYFDRAYEREYEALSREGESEPEAHRRFAQLALAAHAHRLGALWVAVRSERIPTASTLLMPLANLTFWKTSLAPLFAHVHAGSATFLPGEVWGGQPMATYWARPSAEYVLKAALVASGQVTRVGTEALHERYYFDDRNKCWEQENKKGGPSPKSLCLHMRGDDAAVVDGAELPQDLESRVVAQGILEGSFEVGRVPKVVQKRLKKGFVPVVRVSSWRQVFRVSHDVSVVWDSHVSMSVFGTKKAMHTFPFQVVHVVRNRSQGPAGIPGELSGVLGQLIAAPKGTEYSAAASIVQGRGASHWEEALSRYASQDWSVPLQKNSFRAWDVAPSHHQHHHADDAQDFDGVDSAAEESVPLRGGSSQTKLSLSVADLKLKPSARLDPKTYWAAERTLLSWVHIAIFLCVSSAQLLSFGNTNAQIAGACMAPATIIVAVYALLRFHARNLAILNSEMAERNTMFSVVDLWGPWIAVPLMCVTMVVLCIIYFVFQ